MAPFDGDFTFDTFGLKAIKFIKWLNDVRAAAQRAGNVDLNKAYENITLENDAYAFDRDLGRFLGEMGSDGIPCECKPKKK